MDVIHCIDDYKVAEANIFGTYMELKPIVEPLAGINIDIWNLSFSSSPPQRWYLPVEPPPQLLSGLLLEALTVRLHQIVGFYEWVFVG